MGLLARAVAALDVRFLGTIPYDQAWELQTELHDSRVSGDRPDTLLLLEHPHVYTIGRRGSKEEVLWDEEELRARGVGVVDTDRGGRVTYHGPGQLVGYPIVDLGPGADLVSYVRRLEDVLIAALGRFGLTGERDAGNTGVWVHGAKVGAIGVRVSRSVTKHGFALNVAPDLAYFTGIVPCGIADRGVTSMALELGDAPSVSEVAEAVSVEFARTFGYGGKD